uniref:Prenyltransferase n=1 Tax=candidate division WOR-3 bacterium TaxID=2052148 RepID=A0A7C3N6M2_UNCW3
MERNLKKHLRSFFFAIRPYENLQHFLMTVAGSIYATYRLGFPEISSKIIFGLIAVFSFLSQVLSYNNYATFELDLKDKKKRFEERFEGVDKKFLFYISSFFFLTTILFSIFINPYISIYFTFLMLGWALYTHPLVMFKKGVIFPFLLDILTMPFLVIFGSYIFGYYSLDLFIFSFFFGLIEVAGHINHYNVDFKTDKENGIYTVAHKLGLKGSFILSASVFFISSLYFFFISFFKVVPIYTGIAFLPGMFFQIYFFVKVLKSNIDFTFPRNFRKFYRVLYFIESIYVAITLLFF